MPIELLRHPASEKLIVPAQVKFWFFPFLLCYFSLSHTFSWFLKLFFISNLPLVLLSSGNLTSSSRRFNNCLWFLAVQAPEHTFQKSIHFVAKPLTNILKSVSVSGPVVLLSSPQTHFSSSQHWLSWLRDGLHDLLRFFSTQHNLQFYYGHIHKCCSGRGETRELPWGLLEIVNTQRSPIALKTLMAITPMLLFLAPCSFPS